MSDERKIIEWMLGRDTGLSSKTVAAWLGIGLRIGDYPHDCGDFGRCWRLLEFMGWMDRVPELAAINGHWAEIVDHWPAISAAWLKDDTDEVYAILERIEPAGYERDGFEVTRRSTGGLYSATKKDGPATFDMGGFKVSMRPSA